MNNKKSNKIWCVDWNRDDCDNARIVLFRKTVDLTNVPKSYFINISADSQYKLYVNGQLVEFGPGKGDDKIWFYDIVDIAPYLKSGKNVIGVVVLRYPADKSMGCHSVFRTPLPFLYIEDNTDGGLMSANETWKCFADRRFKVIREDKYFAPLMIYEEAFGDSNSFGWLKDDFDDIRWSFALQYDNSQFHGAVSPGNMIPRTTPFLYRKHRQFNGVICIRKSLIDIQNWNDMLKDNIPITIPENSMNIIEFDSGEEMTGFLSLALSGGADSEIIILQSEAYVLSEAFGDGSVPLKKDRKDFINGHLDGHRDIYHVLGAGTKDNHEIYSPFRFRTFRFVQLKITTKSLPLTIHSFDYEETGYPLTVDTQVTTSDKSLDDIWKISERTLKRCMHETYEDCPFYEQLQYAMDSRQQILYTYSVSSDDRLARKCMDDFKRSQRYDGLLNCSYPNCNTNVIPGFSIYYILMVYDHMMYFGDKQLVKYHMPTIDGILNFFDRNLSEEGYVKKLGGVNLAEPFWSFIDWAAEWDSGVPAVTKNGALTMESLLYIMGLQHAAKLAEYIGRNDTKNEYISRVENVRKAILKYCTDNRGIITDGPNAEQYSQHCQVFAALTDTVDSETARKNLLDTIINSKKYAKCTVAMKFYLFRALEKTNLYEYTDLYWNSWRDMIKNNATTCIESETYGRSECHAWGSLALYELPSAILGVKPASAGYRTLTVKPAVGYLDFAKGIVKTPLGNVKVSWKKENGNILLDYEII